MKDTALALAVAVSMIVIRVWWYEYEQRHSTDRADDGWARVLVFHNTEGSSIVLLIVVVVQNYNYTPPDEDEGGVPRSSKHGVSLKN